MTTLQKLLVQILNKLLIQRFFTLYSFMQILDNLIGNPQVSCQVHAHQ